MVQLSHHINKAHAVGADAFKLEAILGHTTIQMCARYTHATSAGLRRALESLATKQVALRESLPTISPQLCESADL